MTLRVVVDANVLIAGFGWPCWPYAVLRHEACRRMQSHLPATLDGFELYLASVGYEEAPLPTQDEIAANLGLVRQENDVPIALSVRAAHVDYFVTYDRDFTDPSPTTAKIRQAIPGIVLPPVFLRDVMGWTSAALKAIRRRKWEEMDE